MRLIPRTRKILRGWKDISGPQEPQRQQCPECGASAHGWWAALSHQTWHISLARLLRAALESTPEGRELLDSFLMDYAREVPARRHESSGMTETIPGGLDTMSPGRHEDEE